MWIEQLMQLKKLVTVLAVLLVAITGVACSESDKASKSKAITKKQEIKVLPGTMPEPKAVPVPEKIADVKEDIIELMIPVKDKYKKGLFWKIERPGYKPSYLLGTMHSSHPEILAMTKVIKKQFNSAATLCTEIKLDMVSMVSMAKLVMYPKGQTLRQNIDEELYQQVVKHAKTLGVNIAEINKMKPWIVNVRLSMPKDAGGVALDMRLVFDATKQKKELCGLEKVKEQLDIFASESKEDQLKALRLTVKHFDIIREQIPKMRNIYLSRDLIALANMVRNSPVPIPEEDVKKMMFKLLVRRNIIMLNRMQPYLKKGNVFFAVGALHLTGKIGLLRLLDEQGYTLTRLY